MISDTAAEDLKKLYRTIIGKSISTGAARERGERLMVLIELADRAHAPKAERE